MPFQTGTATSFINLLDTVRLFAVANAWTENTWQTVGSDQWLSLQKGTIYANMRASATQIQIKGALGYNGASAWNGQPSTHAPTPRIRDGWYGSITWPATYWIFLHTSPDDIVVVLRYQPTRFLYFTIGQLTKYGTYTGGEYFAASSEHATAGIALGTTDYRVAQVPDGSGNTNFAGLFWRRNGFTGGSTSPSTPDVLHAEIDSFTWGGPSTDRQTGLPLTGIQFLASATDHTYPLQHRGINAFNGLMTLLPIEVFARRPDNHFSPLGRVEHMRYANVLNHNAADIIDIGGQKWMLFPWTEKGNGGDSSGQHYGYAVKYDGP